MHMPELSTSYSPSTALVRVRVRGRVGVRVRVRVRVGVRVSLGDRVRIRLDGRASRLRGGRVPAYTPLGEMGPAVPALSGGEGEGESGGESGGGV